MSQDQLISLYLKLTGDIHTYWAAFGGLAVLITGWLLSRRAPPGPSHRLGLTVGWLAAAGYLGSGLMNRYRLVAALASDVQRSNADLQVLRVIAELGPIYAHYEVIVWVSMAAVSVGAMFLIWSNVAVDSSAKAGA